MLKNTRTDRVKTIVRSSEFEGGGSRTQICIETFFCGETVFADQGSRYIFYFPLSLQIKNTQTDRGRQSNGSRYIFQHRYRYVEKHSN